MDLNSKVLLEIYQLLSDNRGSSFTLREIWDRLHDTGKGKKRIYSQFAIMDAVNDLNIHDYLRGTMDRFGKIRYVWKKSLEKRTLKIKINFNESTSNN